MNKWTISELIIFAWAWIAWSVIIYWVIFEGLPAFFS
jgi:hypothetical protein